MGGTGEFMKATDYWLRELEWGGAIVVGLTGRTAGTCTLLYCTVLYSGARTVLAGAAPVLPSAAFRMCGTVILSSASYT